MKTVIIRPVQIIGNCPIGLTLEDEFQIEGTRLLNPKGSKLCFLALGQIPIGQGIWQLQSEERFFSHVSCPGCILHGAQENRVVFLLGHADKWMLCQLISEYLALSKRYGEPETARQAKEEAIFYQNLGDYSEARQKMEIALRELKSKPG
jgi:hypothetical protein